MGKRTGRPSGYTAALADRICEKVAACVPIHKIAKLEGMPTERTIYRWLDAHPEFCQDYVRAREQQADRMVAECREIADTEKDKMDAVDRDRLRVQVRQWAAERMAPKKYGSRTYNENTNRHSFDANEVDSRLARAIATAGSAVGAGKPHGG